MVRTRFIILVTVILAGCRPAVPGRAVLAPAEELDAPNAEAIGDPELRQAREQADATLGGLLAGKLEAHPSLSPVAKKLKGYQSYAVKSQQIVRDGTAEFRGLLSAPSGRVRFDLTLVKQADGRWAVGTFSGPNPE
jgi:hypothetical protein